MTKRYRVSIYDAQTGSEEVLHFPATEEGAKALNKRIGWAPVYLLNEHFRKAAWYEDDGWVQIDLEDAPREGV